MINLPALLSTKLLPLLFCLLISQVVNAVTVLPDGPEQMPVIYVHGYNDDGMTWVRESNICIPIATDGNSAKFFYDQGIENYVLQWWSDETNNPLLVNGDPFSSSDNGYAFLVPSNEMSNDQLPNRPCKPNPLVKTLIQNNYNDSGSVLDHAEDMVELFRIERNNQLRLYRQVNIITHSKGGLDAHTMMSINQNSRYDAEFIANTVYNAPPFAGTTTADVFSLVFHIPETGITEFFNSDWFQVNYATDSRGAGTILKEGLSRILVAGGIDGGIDDPALHFPRGFLNAFDLLNVITIQPLITAVQVGGNTVFNKSAQFIMKYVRTAVSAFSGFPAFPAMDDLKTTTSATRMLTYSSTPITKQFVSYGTLPFINPVLPQVVLFPCNADNILIYPCADNVANLQDSVTGTSIANWSFDTNDMVVPRGSALTLTQSNVYGDPLTLLTPTGIFTNHTKMKYASKLGEFWLNALLAAPTSISIGDNAVVLDATNRVYLVAPTDTMGFESSDKTSEPISGSLTITVSAAQHQFRVIKATDSGLAPSDWVTLATTRVGNDTVSSSSTFAELESLHNLQGIPFFLEWRSINETGGREMIRRVKLIIDTPLPVVSSVEFFGQASNEIYNQAAGALLPSKAIRSKFFESLVPVELANITSQPEPNWVVSNPDTKALTVILSNRGRLIYQWDTNAEVILDNVPGTLIQLVGLSEGQHTLTLRTENGTGAATPTLSYSILIDNTAPLVDIHCSGLNSFRCLVGPSTPLRYDVMDLETHTGMGDLPLSGYPNGSVRPGRTFTLGETDLREAGIAAGSVGGIVDLKVTATDHVNNTTLQNIPVYYDWTAPTITLTNVAAVPTTEGYRSFSAEVQVDVSIFSDNSGMRPPKVAVYDESGGVLYASDLLESTPSNYGGLITLTKGRNRVNISSKDFADNLGELEFIIYYNDTAFDFEPVEILSSRSLDQCYNSSGAVVNCTLGVIENIDSDYYGQSFIFNSSGNRFVPNDSNGENDVYVWKNNILSRVNVTQTNEQSSGGASVAMAISGNGRYAYFNSSADNLISGTSNENLYIKDLETGDIAVISRDFSGNPINRLAANFEADVTDSGRYVFFSSRNANYVSGLSDGNIARDIYMVDLDPDVNGNYFDDNYVTVAISHVPGNLLQTGNGESHLPSVSGNGLYVVFRTAATDIDNAFTANGSTRDILLMKFSVNATTGSLDVSNPIYVPIALDADQPMLSRDNDTVTFKTLLNLDPADTNSLSTGSDIYASLGEGAGFALNFRSLRWLSKSFNNANSTGNGGFVIKSLSVAAEPTMTAADLKVSWVSEHTNIESGDTNAVSDLFVERSSTVFPVGVPAPNWIGNDNGSQVISSADVRSGKLSPDGRYAYWVSQQTYATPYATNGDLQLYRRRIEPLFSTTLTINTIGDGQISRSIAGSTGATANEYNYLDEDTVELVASADIGWRFTGWQGEDVLLATTAIVDMHHSRTVTANFEKMNAPSSSVASITTDEDEVSAAVSPVVVDLDAGDSFVYTIISQATNGTAQILNNQLVYTPKANFNGVDSFEYNATDSFGLSLLVPAVADVTINAVNDAPTEASINITVEQGKTSTPASPSVVDIDTGDSFTLALKQAPSNGSVTISGNQFSYTPDSGFKGDDNFSFFAIDNAGELVTGLGSITVTAVSSGGNGGGGGNDSSLILLLLFSVFLSLRKKITVYLANVLKGVR